MDFFKNQIIHTNDKKRPLNCILKVMIKPKIIGFLELKIIGFLELIMFCLGVWRGRKVRASKSNIFKKYRKILTVFFKIIYFLE